MTKRFRAAVSQLNTDRDGHSATADSHDETPPRRRGDDRPGVCRRRSLDRRAAGERDRRQPRSRARWPFFKNYFITGRPRRSRHEPVAEGRQRKSRCRHSRSSAPWAPGRRAGRRPTSSRRSCMCRRRKNRLPGFRYRRREVQRLTTSGRSGSEVRTCRAPGRSQGAQLGSRNAALLEPRHSRLAQDGDVPGRCAPIPADRSRHRQADR